MRDAIASACRSLRASVLLAALALVVTAAALGCARPAASLVGGEVVDVKLLVGVDGRVKKVRVVRSNSDRWAEFVSKWATGWKYRPATKNGQPVERWVEERVRFRVAP